MLKVWLPLDGDLHNQGLSDAVFSKATNVWGAGKIGAQSLLASTGTGSVMVNELKDKKEFSIAYWVKIDSSLTFSSWQDIWAVDYTNATGTYPIRDEHTSTAGNHQLLMAKETNVGSNTNGYIGMTIANAPDTWQHIVLVKGLTQTKSYVNGELKLTRNNTDFETSNGKLTGNVRIGATTCGAYLNDVRIYDHCLSAAEVKEIAQGLVLHYKLDNNGQGGRNLMRKGTGTFHNTDKLTTITWSGWDSYNSLPLTDIDWNSHYGDYITYSCYMENVEQTAGTGSGIMLHFRYADGTYQQFGGGKNGASGQYLAQGESGWLRLTVAIPNASTRSNPTTIARVEASVRHNSSGGASTIRYQYPQVEYGNKQTAWSWAPEDTGDDPARIEDSSGYNYNGTIVGSAIPAANTARYGISTHIDGAGVITATSPGADIRTLSCWVKTTKNKSTSQMLVADSGSNMCISFYSGTIIGVFGATRSTGSKCTLGASYKENDWNHIVVVKTSDDGKRDIYCNGEKLTPAADDYWSAAAGFYVGNRNGTGSGNTPFFGYISDVRAYCTQLLDTDIKQLYNVGMKVDKLGNSHPFEIDEGTGTQITKTGILKSEQFLETGIQFNANTGFTFKPAANTNNSTTGGIGVVDFSRLRYVGTPITITISCDVGWSNIGYTSTGTNRLYFQGANRLIETGATAWQGSNYLTGWSILDDTKANATGSKHFEKTVTIPAAWFETYDGSQFGMRCDYSDGNGTVTVSNVHVILTSENHFKIKKKNIVATQFIER